MKIDLSGQHILVTGGSRGIGAAIVRDLSEAGATVALHYSSSRAAAESVAAACSSHVQLFQADLAVPGAGRILVQQVLEQLGHLDAVVNNAGIALSIPSDSNPDIWRADWLRTIQVNLIAAAEITDSLIPHFAGRNNGRVIHIASRAAFRGDTPEYAAYAASKGGMVAYSRSIARGYGKQGIKSFVVAPGFTRTDMAAQFMEEYGEDIVRHDLALDSITEPSDISPTVVFLASGMMDHATGCSIDLNAGSYVR